MAAASWFRQISVQTMAAALWFRQKLDVQKSSALYLPDATSWTACRSYLDPLGPKYQMRGKKVPRVLAVVWDCSIICVVRGNLKKGRKCRKQKD